MRFLVMRAGLKGKNKARINRVSVERFLFLAFIVTFIILIAAQAALMNPSIRTFLTSDNEFEGTPLGVEEFLYNEGEIGLELLNAEKDPDLKVLVNGDVVDVFDTKDLSISVKEGDVVEIDGTGVSSDAEVSVVSKSNNISSECIGKSVKVQSNVKKIVKIKMN